MASPDERRPTALELFAGAGGLALGVEDAGFVHLAANDNDVDACNTLRRNREWKILEQDATTVDWTPRAGRVDLLAGGAPCQPFSFGGKHQGGLDARDGFPALFRAIAAQAPKAILLENVRGLARPVFAEYLEYVLHRLARPSRLPRDGESQAEHATRLRHDRTSRREYDVYGPVFLNAADYGIPQTRQRLFMVALRSDLGLTWEWPRPTHSLTALMMSQQQGVYWDRHDLPRADPVVPPRLRLERILQDDAAACLYPWRTLREAIADLPEASPPGTPPDEAAVQFHVGISTKARTYPGHTGNLLDLPGKTVKAGVHGSPGGESIVQLDSGTARRLTIRENARLQTFPDDYAFCGTRTKVMRQIGNAVPVQLASSLAKLLRACIDESKDEEQA